VDSLLFFSFLFPTELISGIAGPEETKNHSGGNVHRLIQIRFAASSLKKSHLRVKHNDREGESQIRVPETPSAFPRQAQRSVFHHRDARQQSRAFARWNQSLTHSHNSNRLC
jgi:hypothetical protein